MIALSVNLNKIALLRNSRSGNFPNVVEYAEASIAAGAKGITVHPRPDQRHIRPTDIKELHTLLKNYADIEFNIEGNPFSDKKDSYPGFIELIKKFTPHQCTLVPDANSQLTSDHGFDLKIDGDRLQPIVAELKKLGVRVSLFMDPILEQINLAKQIDADRIELYTGPFAEAYKKNHQSIETQSLFNRHCAAAEQAKKLNLGINAGHDLNLYNLQLYRTLPHLLEVSIGHALTIDALDMGFDKAVRAYSNLLASPTNF